MATKSKLEQAVEARAGELNDAQRELVKTQLASFKRNRDRMNAIADRLRTLDSTSYATMDEMRARQSERMSLAYEYNQLATANSDISEKLFGFMEKRDGEA